MAIIKNSITFGSGFNITAEGPIDSRMVVEYISDLTTVWNSDAPAYEGMIVSVIEDGNVYTLIDSNFTDINNWKKQGGIEIYSSVDELPQYASHGTLATVSNIRIEEIEVDKFSIRDIYVVENPDCEPIMEIKVKPNQFGGSARVVFAPKGYTADSVLNSDTYFVFLGSNVGIKNNGDSSSITVINDNYGSLSLNEEGVSLLNEFIKSVGGVVLYGQISLSSSIPEQPTETEFNSLEKIFGYSNTEIIETHINDIYFKETTGWRKINDVKIVDSIDKLDINATQGCLATVAVNTISEVSFSELYQPTEEDFSNDIPPIDKLSKVSGISVISPDSSIEIHEFEINMYSEDFNPENGVGSVVILGNRNVVLISMSDESQNMEFEIFIYNEDENTLTVNEESLSELNSILSENGYVYGGTFGTNENGDYGSIDPSVSDNIYRAIGEFKKTDLYIKDVEGWVLYKDTISFPQIEIVDDLNTGGNDKALSAEMGKVLSERIDEVDLKVDNSNIIVDQFSSLPSDVPIGTRASVLYTKRYREDLYSFENYIDVEMGCNLLYPEKLPSALSTGVIATFDVYYSRWINFKLEFKYESYFNAYCLFVYTDGVNSGPAVKYRGNYSGAERYEMNSGLLHPFNYDRVVARTVSNSSTLDVFMKAYEVSKKTQIYVKNENGWEQYSELMMGSVNTEILADNSVTTEKLSEDILEVIENCPIIVNSVDELPSYPKNGTIASVVMDGIILTSLFTLKYPQHSSDQNLGTVSSIYPVNILPTERIVQQTSTQIKFMSRSGSNGSYSTFTIKVFSADLEWSLDHGNNRSGKLIYWEDGEYKVNTVDFDFINDELGSYTYHPISPIAPTKEMFVDIDNFLVTPSVGKRTFLYVKNSTGWEEYDKVNKDKVVILENKVEELDYKIDENANIIVNSVDELPLDVPTGTRASVLYKVEKTELLPVSKAFIAGGKVSGLTIIPPEKADISDFYTDTNRNNLGLNFSTYLYDRGLICIAKYGSGVNAIAGTDGISMPSILVEYDSDGNLKNVNQSLINTLIGNVTTYRTISGSDVLDKYIFANGISTTYNVDLYVKTDEGWRQIKELVDNSVTIDQLSPELKTSIEDVEQLKQSVVVLTEEEYNNLLKDGTINEETIYIVKFE